MSTPQTDQAHSGTTDATRTEPGIHVAGKRNSSSVVFRWVGLGSL